MKRRLLACVCLVAAGACSDEPADSNADSVPERWPSPPSDVEGDYQCQSAEAYCLTRIGELAEECVPGECLGDEPYCVKGQCLSLESAACACGSDEPRECHLPPVVVTEPLELGEQNFGVCGPGNSAGCFGDEFELDVALRLASRKWWAATDEGKKPYTFVFRDNGAAQRVVRQVVVDGKVESSLIRDQNGVVIAGSEMTSIETMMTSLRCDARPGVRFDATLGYPLSDGTNEILCVAIGARDETACRL